MTTPVEKLTYRQAMQELQAIVNRLRGTETEAGIDVDDEKGIDVDELVVDVARAKELLDYCGGKIQKANIQIQNVIRELKPEDKAEMPEAPAIPEPEPFAEPSSGGIPF